MFKTVLSPESMMIFVGKKSMQFESENLNIFLQLC